MERLQRRMAADARAARANHTRDVAQNAELLSQLAALRKEVPRRRPSLRPNGGCPDGKLTSVVVRMMCIRYIRQCCMWSPVFIQLQWIGP